MARGVGGRMFGTRGSLELDATVGWSGMSRGGATADVASGDGSG
jgi:hypothetical protein